HHVSPDRPRIAWARPVPRRPARHGRPPGSESRPVSHPDLPRHVDPLGPLLRGDEVEAPWRRPFGRRSVLKMNPIHAHTAAVADDHEPVVERRSRPQRPTVDDMGEWSFPASDPPATWTWDVTSAPPGAT